MQESIQHTLQIEQRKSLSISGVESVVAFSEVKIVLALFNKERMQIIGTDLKITGFSKTSGTFTAEGTVTGVTYNGKNFVAKLFK